MDGAWADIKDRNGDRQWDYDQETECDEILKKSEMGRDIEGSGNIYEVWKWGEVRIQGRWRGMRQDIKQGAAWHSGGMVWKTTHGRGDRWKRRGDLWCGMGAGRLCEGWGGYMGVLGRRYRGLQRKIKEHHILSWVVTRGTFHSLPTCQMFRSS